MSVLAKVCRLCANTDDYCVSIFSEKGNQMLLLHKMKACSPISVKKSDKFPTQVCLTCLNSLDSCYEFYLEVQNAQVKLKEMLEEEAETGSSKSDVRSQLHATPTKKSAEGPPLHVNISQTPSNNIASLSIQIKQSPPSPKCPSLKFLKKSPPNTPEKPLVTDPSSCPKYRNPACGTSVGDKVATPSAPLVAKTERSKQDSPYDPQFKKCKFCEKDFREDILAQHEKLHGGKPVFTCFECDKDFTNKTAFDKHKCNQDINPI